MLLPWTLVYPPPGTEVQEFAGVQIHVKIEPQEFRFMTLPIVCQNGYPNLLHLAVYKFPLSYNLINT